MERDALETMSDAVLAIAAERSVEPVLQRLVHAARELAGARYAALGIPDGEGAFAQFITAGMSDELIAAMGPLPRTHGLLGAMLESPSPTARRHPARPALPRLVAGAHPQMRSFLGVPIVARGGVIGAFYLTDKDGADEFSRGRPAADRDARGARRGRDRERAALRAQPRAEHRRGAQPPRARPARLGHPEAVRHRARRRGGGTLLERDPDAAARAAARGCGELAQEAIERAALADLRAAPAALEERGAGGDAAQARRRAASACTAARSSCASRATADCAPEAEGEVSAIAQEALNNALRHAGPSASSVRLRGARRAADRHRRRRRRRLRPRRAAACARAASA